jgi:hypothetical protein
MIGGFWKLVLVAVVTLILYGRSGVHRHPVVRVLLPMRRDGAPGTPTPGRSRLGTRVYILLVVTAATAVAAWIATRAWIDPAGLSPR